MQLKVGEIVEGTVKSLTKFGAFVALDANTTGLVHISEVAHTYVSDLHEYLTCLLYTSPSPRDISGSRMPSSA
mgnify:CR=1 FL=1